MIAGMVFVRVEKEEQVKVLETKGAVEVVNEDVEVGDLVQVVKGPLKGLEGELVRFRGVTMVAVRIEMLGCAMVDIPASFVEKLNK